MSRQQQEKQLTKREEDFLRMLASNVRYLPLTKYYNYSLRRSTSVTRTSTSK